MTHVGVEGLALFEQGKALKEQALQSHAEHHASDIAKIRVALLAGAKLAQSQVLTADDAAIVAEQMGILTGKWCGAIFRNWDAVEHTGSYVKSKLPRSRARMVSVWRVK